MEPSWRTAAKALDVLYKATAPPSKATRVNKPQCSSLSTLITGPHIRCSYEEWVSGSSRFVAYLFVLTWLEKGTADVLLTSFLSQASGSSWHTQLLPCQAEYWHQQPPGAPCFFLGSGCHTSSSTSTSMSQNKTGSGPMHGEELKENSKDSHL